MENLEKDLLDTFKFYDLMQSYRIASMSNQKNVIDRFDNVKSFIRENYIYKNNVNSKSNEMLEMLKKLVNEFSHYTELAQGTSKCGAVLDAKQLIKEATEL